MKYYYFISHQWLRSRLEPACNVRFLFHPLNQVLDLGTLVQQLRVVFSHPVDEGEDMKISPGEVVTSKELSSSGLQPRLQNTLTKNRLNWNMIIVLTHQSCRYSLGHDLSGHGALLPLVRLVPGSNPLVDHVIDSINYLISLSHLEVSSASQTILSSKVSETIIMMRETINNILTWWWPWTDPTPHPQPWPQETDHRAASPSHWRTVRRWVSGRCISPLKHDILDTLPLFIVFIFPRICTVSLCLLPAWARISRDVSALPRALKYDNLMSAMLSLRYLIQLRQLQRKYFITEVLSVSDVCNSLSWTQSNVAQLSSNSSVNTLSTSDISYTFVRALEN